MKLPKLPPLAQIRKAVINGTGLLTSLLALGLLPEPEAGWVSAAIAVLTVVTHYKVPNADNPTQPAQTFNFTIHNPVIDPSSPASPPVPPAA